VKIVHVVSRLSRLAGGLFETVPGLTRAVNEIPGMEVSVVGVRDEFFAEDESKWSCKVTALPVSRWSPRKLLCTRGMLRHTFETKASILVCHGLWTHHNYVATRWASLTGRPYLISPHGMLDKVDLRKSKVVKWCARKLYVDRLFRRATCVRAISESEVESTRAFGFRGPICLIPNGIWLPETSGSRPPAFMKHIPSGKKLLFYLGRLNPKKGLPALLAAWSKIQSRSPELSGHWHLVIAGWDQNGHEQELKCQAEALGISASTLFPGPLFGPEKHSAYTHADAFVIPSTSEGMPTVVLEAWAYGVPVLMTPECNLPAGFEKAAAIRIETNPESIAQGLHGLLSMSDAERREMAHRGRTLVEAKFSWPKIGRDIHAVYEWILGRSPRPDSVLLN
jgi:poly(glycerol-phosphate) alpha-glucosyltransferase